MKAGLKGIPLDLSSAVEVLFTRYTTAMDQTEHHQEVNEKKILITGAIIIFIVIALISYFEWRGRHGY